MAQNVNEEHIRKIVEEVVQRVITSNANGPSSTAGAEGGVFQTIDAAVQAGRPVRLDHVGSFTDGAAVRQIGDEPFRIVKDHLDGVIRADRVALDGAIRDSATYSFLDSEWPEVKAQLTARLH